MLKHTFTLVELMITVAIIVILAGILIPVTSSAIKKAEQAKARAEMVTLVNAIKQYEATYGVLPIEPSGNYETFIKMLQGTAYPPTGEVKQNSRGIKFLDIVNNNSGEFKDPWEKDYIIHCNDEGEIPSGDIPHGVHVDGTSPVLHFSVIVWSKGPDGDSDATATKKVNRDNVYSFPTEFDKQNSYFEVTH